MNDVSFPAGHGRRAWLPALAAIPVTAVCGLLTLACLAFAALAGSPPYPSAGWLPADLLAQAALFISTPVLLIAGRARAGARPVTAVLGWVVMALSVAGAIAATMLAQA
jgi:hypothetical protein